MTESNGTKKTAHEIFAGWQKDQFEVDPTLGEPRRRNKLPPRTVKMPEPSAVYSPALTQPHYSLRLKYKDGPPRPAPAFLRERLAPAREKPHTDSKDDLGKFIQQHTVGTDFALVAMEIGVGIAAYQTDHRLLAFGLAGFAAFQTIMLIKDSGYFIKKFWSDLRGTLPPRQSMELPGYLPRLAGALSFASCAFVYACATTPPVVDMKEIAFFGSRIASTCPHQGASDTTTARDGRVVNWRVAKAFFTGAYDGIERMPPNGTTTALAQFDITISGLFAHNFWTGRRQLFTGTFSSSTLCPNPAPR